MPNRSFVNRQLPRPPRPAPTDSSSGAAAPLPTAAPSDSSAAASSSSAPISPSPVSPPPVSSPPTTPSISLTPTPSSSSSTPSTSSAPPSPTLPPPVSTSVSTVFSVAPGPPQTRTAVDSATPSNTTLTSNNLASKGFFQNKAAVAGTFAVVGVAAFVIFFILITTCLRRRRARKFDEEVANAAAVAYADADRERGWNDEADNWDDHPSTVTRAYTTSSGGNTSGTHGAYRDVPMPVPVPGQYYNNEYNMEEFPNRNIPSRVDPFANADAAREQYPIAPGFAGIGTRQNSPPMDMRYRGSPHGQPVADDYMTGGGMGQVDNGMHFDSGRYPVPVRSRSRNSANNGHSGRSLSTSSGGHSGAHSPPPGRYQSPPPSQQPRLPLTREHGDEDPYDGFTPESERSEYHSRSTGVHDTGGTPEEAPRILRVANA